VKGEDTEITDLRKRRKKDVHQNPEVRVERMTHVLIE
jgi:hypothetical protein